MGHEPRASVDTLPKPYAVVYDQGRVWLTHHNEDVGVSLDPIGEAYTTHYLGYEGDELDDPLHESVEDVAEEMVEHFLSHVHPGDWLYSAAAVDSWMSFRVTQLPRPGRSCRAPRVRRVRARTFAARGDPSPSPGSPRLARPERVFRRGVEV